LKRGDKKSEKIRRLNSDGFFTIKMVKRRGGKES
jgi:hypothetical protein